MQSVTVYQLAEFAVLRVAGSTPAGCASPISYLHNSKFQKIFICATFVPSQCQSVPAWASVR